MTVKIGMVGPALDLKDAKVWGYPANKIMVGTGTSAVEVWSSITYPLEGSWGPLELGQGEHVMGTHVITHDGLYRIVHTIPEGTAIAAIRHPYEDVIGTFNAPSVAETYETFVAGDVIEFGAAVLVGTPVVSGTWSVEALVSWVDDFTTPQLHSRWELLNGAYTPPGLGVGQEVETHLPSEDCRLDVRGTIEDGDYWGITISDGPGWNQEKMAEIYCDSSVIAISTELDYFETDAIVSPTDTVSLTVVAGVATLLLNGTPLASLRTGLADTKWLIASVGGSQNTRITHLAYAEFVPLPVVTITGTSGTTSRTQFRDACIAYGTTYQTVETLPFRLDTSQATNLTTMFVNSSALKIVPPMDTSNVTDASDLFRGCAALEFVPDLAAHNLTRAFSMFEGCTSLMDGNVRLIGKHLEVATNNMIWNSGLTREPWYDAEGNFLIYPLRHIWSLNEHTLYQNTLMGSHTVESAGSYTITNTIFYGYASTGFGSINPTARLVGPSTVTGTQARTSTATATWNLSAGQTVYFRGDGNSSTVYEGEWTVIKN